MKAHAATLFMPDYGALAWIVGGLLTPVPVLRIYAFLMKLVTHHWSGLSMFFLIIKVGCKKAVFSLDALATANLISIMARNASAAQAQKRSRGKGVSSCMIAVAPSAC